jgi:hypothetical protein
MEFFPSVFLWCAAAIGVPSMKDFEITAIFQRCNNFCILKVDNTNNTMEVHIRHQDEPIEIDCCRIKIHGNEFLLKQVADGLHVMITPARKPTTLVVGGIAG